MPPCCSLPQANSDACETAWLAFPSLETRSVCPKAFRNPLCVRRAHIRPCAGDELCADRCFADRHSSDRGPGEPQYLPCSQRNGQHELRNRGYSPNIEPLTENDIDARSTLLKLPGSGIRSYWTRQCILPALRRHRRWPFCAAYTRRIMRATGTGKPASGQSSRASSHDALATRAGPDSRRVES